MNALALTQREVLHAIDADATDGGELRVAESRFRATSPRMPAKPKPPASSTPTLQHWLEDRGGWLVLLICALSALILTACSGVEPKREPAPRCVDGRVVQQVGRWGPYQTPIVRVTETHCKRTQNHHVSFH
ncbi:hypothetical protein P3W24_03835 [Luteibacter sp. PPL201]|uniref:Uncharacterized protein n=1 Tax=Luteibacter sahnii TaxID=3021977 RepID=A0ABT6B7P4_9GAMM